jgi:EpsD family peptidyl-prolyl cis-trans isomerase
MSKSVFPAGPLKRRGLILPSLLGVGMLLAGCNKSAPTGQVVATVNGKEVTRYELSVEPAAVNAPPGTDLDTLLPGLLNTVIDRKIAAQEARKRDFDKRPDYIARTARINETMLAEDLFNDWTREAPAPSESEIRAFIAANPQAFAHHRVYTVDQVTVASAGARDEDLQPLNSISDIAGYLRSHSQPFARSVVTLDSASLNPKFDTTLSSQPRGNPLVLHNGPVTTIISVLDVRDEPVDPSVQREAAIGALKRKKATERLNAARKAAEIKYATGYGK